MKLVKKTFDTVLGLCLDGVQVAEASDQDVLDAYAQIPKDVRELDASMRAAKEAGKNVTDEIFREDDGTIKLRGHFNVDHVPPAMPGTLKDTAAAMDFGTHTVKEAVEKLGEGGGHKVEGPVLVNPDLPVLPWCAPGHEKAIGSFQKAIERGYDNVAILRGRLAQLESRESTWKERVAKLEERSALLDRVKDGCNRIHLTDEELIPAVQKLYTAAMRTDRAEEEVFRKNKRIQELEMRVCALQKELVETHDGETRAKLAERRAMWRARCEEAERRYDVFAAQVREIVGGHADGFVNSLRKMKAEHDRRGMELERLKGVEAHVKALEAAISEIVAEMPESQARPRDMMQILRQLKLEHDRRGVELERFKSQHARPSALLKRAAMADVQVHVGKVPGPFWVVMLTRNIPYRRLAGEHGVPGQINEELDRLLKEMGA